MASNSIDTIIVGGGISGLGAARTLHDAGKQFLLISPELGGRIHAETAGGEVPHGTAYVCEDYLHMRKFTDQGSSDKKSANHYWFWNGTEYVSILNWKNLAYLPKFLQLARILKKFRKHINAYRAKSAYQSLKTSFEEDPFLLYTWQTPAKEFIRQHGFEAIDRIFVNPIVATTTFAESDEINTAYYLGMALPLVCKTWRADFTHTIERLTKGFEGSIENGVVTNVAKTADGTYGVTSSVGNFVAKNVILAAPQRALKDVYAGIPVPHRQIDMHTLNVHGTRRPPYDKKPVVFLQSKLHHGIFALFELHDGVDLIYSTHGAPNLDKYYSAYTIVRDVSWQPAMIVPDDKLIPQELDTNLYLASDYNISGLEEAFLTGLSAAKAIIRSHEVLK